MAVFGRRSIRIKWTNDACERKKREGDMERCKLNHPVLMVHGTGFRDSKIVNYWGRIPKTLEAEGAALYYGGQDSWGSVEENALALKDRILSIVQETGCGKVNIIAHSKGGLEARYLVSSLGMEDKVASITTIATPHHGSRILDLFTRFPKFILVPISWIVDVWFRVLGDRHPAFLRSVNQMNTKNMRVFNEKNPDREGVFYQSYGFKMKTAFADLLLFFNYLVLFLFEGENDGVVSVQSMKWTSFKGPFVGSGRRGISHLDEVDFRRLSLSKRIGKEGIADIRDFYCEIVERLKDEGC